MNPYIRDRINRKLDTLTDERLYQVLDYVEFLEARYAEKPAAQANVFQRFAEGVEDKLRAGGVAASTVAETMGFLGKAMNVLNGVAQTGMNVATDVVSKAKSAAEQVGAAASSATGSMAAAAGTTATNAPSTTPSGTQSAPPAAPTSASGMPPGSATPPGAAA